MKGIPGDLPTETAPVETSVEKPAGVSCFFLVDSEAERKEIITTGVGR